MTRIVTWNIRSGGGSRVPAILRTVHALRPDVLVLTEFRYGRTGCRMRDGLASLGLRHQQGTSAAPSVNSVMIASRADAEANALDDLPPTLGHRLTSISIGDITVAGVYFAQRAEKRPLFDWLRAAGSERFGPRSVLIGDFNTGRSDLDSESKGFHVEDGFRGLETVGWTDLWRREHGALREYTWRSRTGNGFRIDHAFGSTALLPCVRAVRYEHAPRREKVSDHSALVVDLDAL